jgi:hypothetical protein
LAEQQRGNQVGQGVDQEEAANLNQRQQGRRDERAKASILCVPTPSAALAVSTHHQRPGSEPRRAAGSTS